MLFVNKLIIHHGFITFNVFFKKLVLKKIRENPEKIAGREALSLQSKSHIYYVSSAYTKPMYGATEMMIAATTNIGIKVFSIVFRYTG